MEEIELHYNYVIVGCEGYYLVGYRDVMNLPCVSYHKDYWDGFRGIISRQLLRWNFSRQLNRCIHTPFSWYVYPRLYPYNFPDDKPLCYVFFGNLQYIYQTSYLDYLRSHVPDVKIVLYMQDLVARNHQLHLERVANKFDLMITYDSGDAEKYNLAFHPTPMSRVEIAIDKSFKKSDIYFCGYAKNRWKKVHDVFRQCQRMGLRCDFNILDLPLDAERLEGINYITSPFSYIENLQHVISSHCVLEIMQDNADGFTPRLWESIMYDRHLLTNNNTVFESSFYYSLGHHSLEILNNKETIKALTTEVSYPDTLKESLSPRHLLSFIDKNLLQE